MGFPEFDVFHTMFNLPRLTLFFFVTNAQILFVFHFTSDITITYQHKHCALIGQGSHGPMTSFLLIYGPEHRLMAQHYGVIPPGLSSQQSTPLLRGTPPATAGETSLIPGTDTTRETKSETRLLRRMWRDELHLWTVSTSPAS